jgi:hypothetical protein
MYGVALSIYTQALTATTEIALPLAFPYTTIQTNCDTALKKGFNAGNHFDVLLQNRK